MSIIVPLSSFAMVISPKIMTLQLFAQVQERGGRAKICTQTETHISMPSILDYRKE